jgi:hypothetical protein
LAQKRANADNSEAEATHTAQRENGDDILEKPEQVEEPLLQAAKQNEDIQSTSPNILYSKMLYKDKIDYLSKHLEGKELTPEQQDIASVYLGKKNIAEIKTDDINTLKSTLNLEEGSKTNGAKHIIFDHFGERTTSVSPKELLDIVDIIRKSDIDIDKSTGRRVYTSYADDGARLRVVVDEHKKGSYDFIVSFYSNRKKPAGEYDTPFSTAGLDKILPQASIKSQDAQTVVKGMFEQKGAGGVMTVFKSGDITTWIHETAHYLEQTLTDVERGVYDRVFGKFEVGRERSEAFAEGLLRVL